MQDSIFTKIIKGEIPSHKIYEDEYTFAFLDIHPIQPGHTLVVPKKQVEFLWDLDEETYLALMKSVKKVGERLKMVMGTAYVGLKVEGVEVPHVHVKVIPFNTTAEYENKPDMTAEPDHTVLRELASKIAF